MDTKRAYVIFFLMAFVVLAGCTKEREIASPDDDLSCLGCHSDEAALQALLAEGDGIVPAPEGRGDG